MGTSATPPSSDSPVAVFRTFLRLGLTSFGGPTAHLGYFRREFVVRRRWLSEQRFAQWVALSQFLPGPSSSQLGFALGLWRAGWGGALAAFLGFTLPSLVLMVAFARALPSLESEVAHSVLVGLKLVALVVVSHAVLGMFRSLAPDRSRVAILVGAFALLLVWPTAWMHVLVVAAGALAGWALCRHVTPAEHLSDPWSRRTRGGLWLLLAFVVGLTAAFVVSSDVPSRTAVAGAFYESGSLVFGGGHVVLPLLFDALVTPGWVSGDDFYAGYGAAQAVPGPMFSFAAFLGTRMPGSAGGLGGAAVATVMIFLPGFLLIASMLPRWDAWAGRPSAVRLVAGANAAVVGLLASVLPAMLSGVVLSPGDLAIAVAGFALLATWRVSALTLVLCCVAARVAGTFLAPDGVFIG